MEQNKQRSIKKGAAKMDKYESEKLTNEVNNNHEETKNETMIESPLRKFEYINIYWDEWNM